MRKYWLLPAAALLALAVAGPASADPVTPQAVNVLTLGGDGGPNVPQFDDLTSGLKAGTSATFFSTSGGSTGITCTVSTFRAEVRTNPVAPGTATESLTAQTFSSCTENITGVTSVQSIVVNNLPYNTSVTSAGVVTIAGTVALPIRTTIRLNTILGQITCVYQANNNTVTGTAVDADNSIRFVSQQFNRTMGPGTCFANGFFTATYAPVVDADQAGTPLVFVN